MDSGTEASSKEEVVQPVEVVETETEITKANPQAEATEQEELYIDEDEGDQDKQPTNGMTHAQAKAGFREEKRKRKDKQKQIDRGNDERAAMQVTIDKLQEAVGKITKGEPPTLESCDYDESSFQQKTREYYSSPSNQQQEVAEPEAQPSAQDDEAGFYLYQKEQELTKLLPGYQKSKDALLQTFADDGMEKPDAAMLFLANIAQQKGVDIAKAVMTMERIPSILEDIKRAGNNQIMIGDILEKAANKVKTRTKKLISTQPEPEINSTGAIDGGNEAVKKLRQQWVDEPSSHNYNLYQKAKKNKVKT